ncbi:MAG: hypothetical protein WC540_07435 [Sulfuritalea sp.]
MLLALFFQRDARADIANEHRSARIALLVGKNRGSHFGGEAAAVSPNENKLNRRMSLRRALAQGRGEPGIGRVEYSRSAGELDFLHAAAQHAAGCRIGLKNLTIGCRKKYSVQTVFKKRPMESFACSICHLAGLGYGVEIRYHIFSDADWCSAATW